jgi:hypothetical protein
MAETKLDTNSLALNNTLGVGVTPSAWSTSFKAIQIMAGGGIMADNANLYLTANAYWNGSNWIRQTTNPVLRYALELGAFTWQIAPSAAAGTAATLTQAMTLDASGNLLVGAISGSNHAIQRAGAVSAARILGINNATGANVAYFWNQAVAVGENAADACMYLRKDATTNRSLNAAGTVNASGADYAEYMTKADTCGTIGKGQIVGVDANGQLTDLWAGSVSFLIKSTNPSYVGGDVWGTEAALDMTRPAEPTLVLPEYAGSVDPGPAPIAPDAPLALPEDADIEQQLAFEQVEAEYDAALALYQGELEAYQAALTVYEQEQSSYTDAVAAAHEQFDAAMLAHQQNLATFNAVLEAARQQVDRIAYCGQVPVNVTGATPGQYVVAVQDGDGIGSVLVDDDAITFAQYRRAVGIVQNVLPDGRANVRVKVV